MSVVILVILVAIVLLVALTVFRTVRIVNQGLVGVVLRVGQFTAVRQPGMRILAPFVDRMVLVDMRETPRTGERQDVITKDNVSLAVNATIFSQVVEPRLALFAVSNYFVAIDQLARTTLRSVMGSMSLDECLSEREKINSQLQMAMESVTDKWGIRINRVEILDIVPPQQILQAMALQKQADQERRAAILQSEGQQQAAINVSEGTKQASIRQAEGEKQAAILRAEASRQALILTAEGSKQAQVLEAEGRAQAVSTVYQAITSSRPTPELLAVLQLDTLGKVATSPNSKIVVPFESAGLMGAAQALRSMISSVPEGANGALPASGD
ncbi:MAG TPA: SPFH domain-containing protein [Candidatus Dormibacteraeota bacterium]|jgi:regulator of protease activity HflC (stomatin/prohibitin superfamily)|nr:SPFH domain-containing protein [Candidatus Dormibacteraeota bacterium]